MSDKILNPATGRYVKASGRIGQALLKIGQPKTRRSKEPVASKNPVTKLVKRPKQLKREPVSKQTKLVKSGKQSKQDKHLDLDIKNVKHALESHPNIKLAIDQDIKTMFPFQFNSQNDVKYNATISGHYSAQIYFAFVFLKTGQVQLLVKQGDLHIVMKNLQVGTNSATIFSNKNQDHKDAESLVNKLLDAVFNINIKFGPVATFKYMVPKTYKRLVEKHYYVQPKTPPTIARDDIGIPNDPCFMRHEDSNRIYVFHTDKDLNSMKGYKPIGITVVERTMSANSKRYKYSNKMIITYPSWATYDDTDPIKLSEYMQEIFNIIDSVPWLAKFRSLSPYPKTIVNCKVGTYQTQFQQC